MITKKEIERILFKSESFDELLEYIDPRPDSVSEISKEDLMYINDNGELDDIITQIDENLIFASFDLYNYLVDDHKYVFLKESFLMKGDY